MRKTREILLILIILLMTQLFNASIVSSQKDILSKDEKEFLHGLGEIQILVDDYFPPISYFDNERGEYAGIAVEVIDQISEILGFDYNIIKDDLLSWSDKLKMIENNEVHILGGASRNEDREKYAYFTDETYFETNYAIIGSVDNHIVIRHLSDISKYRIGLIRDTGINKLILENISEDTYIEYFTTMEEALLSLKNNEIDLITDNEAVFIDEYFNNKRFDFEILFSIYNLEKRYAYITPKTQEGLRLGKILDKAMKEIDINSIVADRYENKSIFTYYKEYSEELRHENMIKNIGLSILIFLILIVLAIIAVIRFRNKELRLIARRDNLTKLKNRNALFDDYRKRDHLNGKKVYFIDLDEFKFINDNYGHEAGDEVLREISKRLTNLTPKSDIYRMGGDEFLLITDNIGDSLGKNILEIIQKPIIYEGVRCKVYSSIGYLVADDFLELQIHEIINLVDYAMLEAKARGKNNILGVNADMIEKYKDLLGKKHNG